MEKGKILYECKDQSAYTGKESCLKKETKTVGLLVTKLNAKYPMDAQAFNEGIENEYINGTGLLRLTPINDVRITSNDGGDVATEDVGYGETAPVGFNGFSQTYRVDGGVCLMKQLRRLSNSEVRVIRIDDQNGAFGTIVTDRQGDHFAGYKAILMVGENHADGSTGYFITLYVYYSSNYDKERERAHMVMLDSVPTGLLGVVLQKGTATGTARVVSSCSGEDYTANYGGEWTPAMFVNEAGTNPTTVTFSEGTGLLTIAPTTSPWKLASASVLSGGNILGLEGVDTYVDLS